MATDHRLKYLEFVVDGKPAPKERARVVFVNGRARSYTPRKTRVAEEYIKHCAVSAMGKGRLSKPFAGPIGLTLTFHFKPPAASKKQPTYPRRCDLDNLVKTVLDALNGVVYKDDSEITVILAVKSYCKPGDLERTKIAVTGEG